MLPSSHFAVCCGFHWLCFGRTILLFHVTSCCFFGSCHGAAQPWKPSNIQAIVQPMKYIWNIVNMVNIYIYIYIYIYGRKITLFVVCLGERSSVIVAELEERHWAHNQDHLLSIYCMIPKQLAIKPYQTCQLAALVSRKAGQALLHFLSKHGMRALDGNNDPYQTWWLCVVTV